MVYNNISLDTIVKKNQHIDTTDINEDKVINNLERGICYVLNDIGIKIWNLIGEGTQVKDIINNLSEECNIEDEKCILKIKDYLEALNKAGLIVLTKNL